MVRQSIRVWLSWIKRQITNLETAGSNPATRAICKERHPIQDSDVSQW